MRALLICLCGALLGAAEPAAPAAPETPASPPVAAAPAVDAAAMAEADALLDQFDPGLLDLGPDGKPKLHMEDAFTAPASDFASEVAGNTWFSLIIFMPFLVLPQVLLIYIIFKYRDRGDGRKPATFRHNFRLEVAWTAVPVVALVIVAAPAYDILYRMEATPREIATTAMNVEVIASRYRFDYRYLRLGGADAADHDAAVIEIGSGKAELPEPLVLVKGRPVVLHITSQDVNHAWWIPAFGIKKDAYQGRFTNAWFKPTRTGFFKGACAELCGADHGIMLASAVVVEEADFARWMTLQAHRREAVAVWRAAAKEAGAASAAVAAYLAQGDDAERRRALRYWAAQGAAMQVRKPDQPELGLENVRAAAAAARQAIEGAILAQGSRS